MKSKILIDNQQNSLNKINPRTKLVIILFSIEAVFLARSLLFPIILFIALFIPLSIHGKIFKKFLLNTFRFVIPLSLFIAIMQGLFYPGGKNILFSLGPLSINEEGLIFALRLGGRILIMVSSFLFLTLSTHPSKLMASLVEKGVSPYLPYIFVSALQIIPQMQLKAKTIIAAQTSRGLNIKGGFASRIKALIPLISPLILSSLVDIEEKAIALEARSFSRKGPKSSFYEIHDSKFQRMIRKILIFLALLLLIGYIYVY
jgi:energy-coupling factor transport system permease protein